MNSESDARRTERERQAEQIFLEALNRSPQGQRVDAEALADEHSELADEILRVAAGWSVVALIGEAATRDSAIAGELAQPNGLGAIDAVLQLAFDPVNSERYSTLEEIARGGMGTILTVWDAHLKRRLAMKVSLAHETGKGSSTRPSASRSLYRFLEEAQVMSQLDHPGVVPVHDIGVDPEGHMYFTMRLVKGHNLKAVFNMVATRSQGWTVNRALGVLVKVCETLGYAHSKGVIHRDLKPANIMVGRFGQTYVMDWGLARVLGREDTQEGITPEEFTDARSDELLSDRAADGRRRPDLGLLTREGSVIGTPAYMPPEQARGALELIGMRSDVYSVGAMLYELLSGCAPFADEASKSGHVGVLQALRAGPPSSLQRLAPEAPEELVSIAEKAMAREVSARYGSMESMADDLRAYQEGRAVKAHATGAFVELRKWVERNRTTAMVYSLGVVLLVGISLALAYVQTTRGRELEKINEDLSESTKLARENETLALAERDRADAEGYASHIAAAHGALLANRVDFARVQLERCSKSSRGWEWDLLEQGLDASARTLRDPESRESGWATSLAPLPGGGIAAGYRDGKVRLWEEDGTRLLARLDQGGRIRGVACSADGDRLLVGDERGVVQLWDRTAGAVVASARHQNWSNGVAVDPTGRWCASASEAGFTVLYSSNDLSEIGRLDAGSRHVFSTCFLPDGQTIVTAESDQSLKFWSVPDGGLLESVQVAPRQAIYYHAWDVVVSPQGNWIACGGFDGRVRLLDAKTRRVERNLTGSTALTRGVAFSADGTTIAAASSDHTVRVWDVATGESLYVGRGHTDTAWDVAFGRESDQLFSCSGSGNIKVWDLEGDTLVQYLDLPFDSSSLALAPDGRRAIVGSGNRPGFALIVDTKTLQILRRLPGVDGPCSSNVAWSSDGKYIAAGLHDGRLMIWDADTYTLRSELHRKRSRTRAIAFHPDGRLLACGHEDGLVQLWNTESGSLLESWESDRRSLFSLAWTPEGDHLITGHGDGSLRIREVSGGDVLNDVREHADQVRRIVFDSSGTMFATASRDHTIRLWEFESLRVVMTLKGHTRGVFSVAFSPDGTRLVSVSEDQSLRIWDLESGAEVFVTPDRGWIVDVEFDANGDRILAAGSMHLLILDRTGRRLPTRSSAAWREGMQPYVRALMEDVWVPSVAMEQVEADSKLSDQQKTAAQSIIQVYHGNPHIPLNEGWKVLASADSEPVEYERAMSQVLAARELLPTNPYAAANVMFGHLRTGAPDRARPWIEAMERDFAAIGMTVFTPHAWAGALIVQAELGEASVVHQQLPKLLASVAGGQYEREERLLSLLAEIEAALAEGGAESPEGSGQQK